MALVDDEGFMAILPPSMRRRAEEERRRRDDICAEVTAGLGIGRRAVMDQLASEFKNEFDDGKEW